METNFEYHAFISYNHKDEKWAKRLQNKLEAYKISPSLSKEAGKELPKTFYPCCRDITSFCDNGELSEIIKDKLQKSQYLIVVCSPNSAKSKWVNEEVKTFQAMGRSDKIIAFIIEGEVNESNKNVHCYPEALKDKFGFSVSELGEEKAILKTIAMMLGLGDKFDIVWNRHRERILKKRIRIAVFSAVFIAVIGFIFILLTIRLAEQKNEISKQYARAEKLINAFYFYDDKFALAYKDEKFYFIDKNGDIVEKLGQWQKVEHFDFYTGFAKVVNYNEVCLLDTLGSNYKYTNTINELDSTIQALDLSWEELSKIPKIDKEEENFINLRYLQVNGNLLNNLPVKIDNLTNLKILILSCPAPTPLFVHFNIHPPEVNNFRLRVFPPEISNLTNLTDLDLANNQLSVLPPEISKLINLTKLVLAGNQLSILPPEIGELTNLTNLVLARNQLNVLPPEIGKLKNLAKLNLYGNQLSVLPPEIGKLTNLTELILYSNRLNALPPEIGNLVNLKNLVLTGNTQLSVLPSEIGKLTNLTELSMWNNQLSVLPPEIGKLANLTNLDLSCNQLTKLPPEIENLSNLKKFFWYGNPLDSLSIKRAKRIENRILQNKEK